MNGVAVRRDDEAGLKVKTRKCLVPFIDVAGKVDIVVLADLAQRFVLGTVHVQAGLFGPVFHRVAHGKAGQKVFRQDDQARIRANETLAGRHLRGACVNGRLHTAPGIGNVQGVDRAAADLQGQGVIMY